MRLLSVFKQLGIMLLLFWGCCLLPFGVRYFVFILRFVM